MSQQRDDDVSGGGLPWGFVLDPAANARALTEVQRRGLAAARRLAEQVASSIDTGDRRGRSGQPPGPTERDVPEGLGDLVVAWGELAARTVSALAHAVQSVRPSAERPAGASLSVDVTDAGRPAPLHLESDRKGQLDVPGELTLANPTTDAVGPIRLRSSNLESADGAVVAGSAVQFEPATVAELPARSTRTVAVTLAAGQPMEPRTYRGLLQAEGAGSVCVTLQLTVRPSP